MGPFYKKSSPSCTGFFVVCCLLAAALPAQQPAAKQDSLLKLLATAREDTNKVNLLLKVGETYLPSPEKQKAILYDKQMVELAQKLGWVEGQLKGYNELSRAYAYNGDYKKMMECMMAASDVAERNKLIERKYQIRTMMGYMYASFKNYDSALAIHKAVAEHYLQSNPKGIDSTSWFTRSIWWPPAFAAGSDYAYLKNDTGALHYYQQLLDRFAKEKDSLGIRSALNLLMRYSNDFLEDYNRSRKYCFEELKYFRKGDTTAAHASVITYIANSYRLQNNYVKALEYYRDAMALKPETHIEIRNSANSGMRLIYSLLGDHGKALNLDLVQLDDAVKLGSEYYYKNFLYGYIADDYTQLKQYDNALVYLHKSKHIADSINGVASNREVLTSIAHVLYLRHHYDEALDTIRKAILVPFRQFDEYSFRKCMLYQGMIIRDAPDSVLRRYGVPPARRYQEAVKNLLPAVKYFDSIHATRMLPDCFKEISITYDSMKDYRHFHDAYKRYIALRDSSINRESQNAFISRLADIQYEKKEDSLQYQQRITNGKLRQQTLLTAQQKKYYLSGIIALLAVSFFIGRNFYNQRKSNRLLTAANMQITQANQEITAANTQITTEKQRSDTLLLNILPADVAEELKEKGTADARLFEEVTVLFTDFVNFTAVGEMLTPQELVDELHACFKAFDEIISKHNIEKIKTIGDAYLAVAGLPHADLHHAENTIRAALEIRQFIHQRKEQLGSRSFDIRIGIHSGSVVAGIVGVKKFAYDIWGDTVNTAARMEQHSLPGQINLSEKTYALVKDQFAFTYRGEIEAKNKGALRMYFVEKQPAGMPLSS